MQEPPAIMFAFGILFLLLRNCTMRRGAWLGFLFGMGHFTLGFSWLLTSIHTHGGFPLPLAIIMLLLFSAVIAIYPALFGALLPVLAPRPEVLPLVAPALWVVTEWLRSNMFTGFGWNLVGYSWNNWPTIIQLADLGGIYLLSWLLIFPAALGSLLWLRRHQTKFVLLWSGVLTVVFAVTLLYGRYNLDFNSQAQQKNIYAPPLRVAMVQGNISQEKKWDPEFINEAFLRYLDLSRSLETPVDLVVWPETAVAFFLQSNPKAIKRIGDLSKQVGAPVLTGGPMADKMADGRWNFYNSAVLLDDSRTLKNRYNKHHLVPFGEYIPLRNFIPASISKLTEGTSDFTPGPPHTPLEWSYGNIGMLICYEAIFPDEVRKLTTTGVRWLINITNDAWFGEAAKPQHLAMTRIRAVENRLPLIRVANTGISAAFDQNGTELARIEANTTGIKAVTVPRGHGQSLFRKAGHVWIWFWLYLSLASWLPGIWRRLFFRQK